MRRGSIAFRFSRENLKAIEPRRMGVQLDANKITTVFDDGRAFKAGWKEGDLVLAIDGEKMTDRDQITEALQQGEPVKVFSLQRGEEKIESKLDWSDTAGEKARAERAK